MNAAEQLINKSIEVKLALIAQGGAETIEKMSDVITQALRAGKRFYLLGNGGSAADAQHIAGELVGRFLLERKPLPVMAFTTDTSVLTAIANDYGYDEAFTRQVDAFVSEGDVVLGITTSGNSPNVVNALVLAREKGATVLALSGRDGGKVTELADVCLTVPAETSPRIQEAHITVGHILCELVEKNLFG